MGENQWLYLIVLLFLFFFLDLSSDPCLLTAMESLSLGFVYLLLTSLPLFSSSSVWFSNSRLTRKGLKYVSAK